MFEKVKEMLGFFEKDASKKDEVSASVTIASQRNERANRELKNLLNGHDDDNMSKVFTDMLGRLK